MLADSAPGNLVLLSAGATPEASAGILAPVTAETAPRRAVRPRRRGLLVAGVLFLLLGVAGLTWSAWDLFRSPIVDPAVAAARASDLRQQWRAPAGEGRPRPGEAVALLRIPAFGDGFEQPVLAGTDPGALGEGVGWYDDTAAPGGVGNFAVAGHGGRGDPFSRMKELEVGDAIVVETRAAIYTYALTHDPGETTVLDTDTWVIQPVPGRPETKPVEALVTLTTGGDLFRSPRRTIAFGTLVNTQAK